VAGVISIVAFAAISLTSVNDFFVYVQQKIAAVASAS
jgi:hypothetical protein